MTKVSIYSSLVLTTEWMFFSVVISWKAPNIANIWIAVGVILK